MYICIYLCDFSVQWTNIQKNGIRFKNYGARVAFVIIFEFRSSMLEREYFSNWNRFGQEQQQKQQYWYNMYHHAYRT